jgi:hypothetical protein
MGAVARQFVQWLVHGVDVRRIVTRIPAEASYISLVQDVQMKTGTHPATHVVGTGGKAAVVWSWQLTFI